MLEPTNYETDYRDLKPLAISYYFITRYLNSFVLKYFLPSYIQKEIYSCILYHNHIDKCEPLFLFRKKHILLLVEYEFQYFEFGYYL